MIERIAPCATTYAASSSGSLKRRALACSSGASTARYGPASTLWEMSMRQTCTASVRSGGHVGASRQSASWVTSLPSRTASYPDPRNLCRPIFHGIYAGLFMEGESAAGGSEARRLRLVDIISPCVTFDHEGSTKSYMYTRQHYYEVSPWISAGCAPRSPRLTRPRAQYVRRRCTMAARCISGCWARTMIRHRRLTQLFDARCSPACSARSATHPLNPTAANRQRRRARAPRCARCRIAAARP
jgi:hypothetical protein